MVFGLFKKGQTIVANVTNLDLLQAISAASLYVASSGGIDADELDQIKVSLATNKALSSFSQSQITGILGGYKQQLEQSPRMGKLAMKKEIEDIKDPEQAQIVFAVACDVADQGDISPDEKARLIEVAGWLRVNPSDFGL